MLLDIEQWIVNILTSDSQLVSLLSAAGLNGKNNILFGNVDVPVETQQDLIYPQVNIHLVSESVRTVPLGAMDIRLQIDIFSRNDQIEVENIYSRILQLLNFTDTSYGTTKLFWCRLSEATDMYETSARIWHRSFDFTFWAFPQ